MESQSFFPETPGDSPGPLAPTTWAAAFAPLLAALARHSRRAVREEYATLHAEQAAAEAEARRNEEPLSIKQAAGLLGITPQTTWEWQKRGLLPSYRLGKRILFRRGDVLAALYEPSRVAGRPTNKRSR